MPICIYPKPGDDDNDDEVWVFSVLTAWETANRYVLRNSMSQQIYYAAEESDVCARQCCAGQRGFVMHITDNMGQVSLVMLKYLIPN